MNRVKKNKKKGFTLVELMIVVVIMVILAAAATPIFKGYLDRAKQARYLAECRSLYVAAQTVSQDWLIAGKTLPSGGVNVNDETPKDDAATLANFANDVQKIAQLEIVDGESYVLNIGTDGCTEVKYTNGAFEVTFTPKTTEVKVENAVAGS